MSEANDRCSLCCLMVGTLGDGCLRTLLPLMLQREPVAADAMADPVEAPVAESPSDEDEGDVDGDAWATDSSGDEDAGSGSEAESSEEEE